MQCFERLLWLLGGAGLWQAGRSGHQGRPHRCWREARGAGTGLGGGRGGRAQCRLWLEFGGDINRIAAGRYGWKVRGIADLHETGTQQVLVKQREKRKEKCHNAVTSIKMCSQLFLVFCFFMILQWSSLRMSSRPKMDPGSFAR